MASKKPIRVLIVEDSEFDARILVNTLRQGGYDPFFRRVETAEAMRQTLEQDAWEVVLSDYNLPQFNAPQALQVLQASGLDLPFIIISGGIGEDIAVAAMKSGAHDYLMKGNLARLVPAVEREMREATTRRAATTAERALRESEQRNRLLWEHSTDAVILMDPTGIIRFANPAVELIFGFPADAVIGQSFSVLLDEGRRGEFGRWIEPWSPGRVDPVRKVPIETLGCHRLHREVFIEIAFSRLEWKDGHYLVAFVRDTTERKRAEQESRLLQGISLGVNAATDLGTALAVVLRAVCEATGWALGQAWLPAANASRLECSPAWCGDPERMGPFRTLSESLQHLPGDGMVGRAWVTRQPVWIDDMTVVRGSPRAAVAREVGLVAGAAIPVMAEGEVVAVIEFFLTEHRQEDRRMLDLLNAVAAQLGGAIQQKRNEQELKANEEEFRAAREIQERLFPEAPPRLPGFDLAGRSMTASAAGGDYFDFLPMPEGRWGIAIGDVTGHGIGPALLMAETRACLRLLAHNRSDVADILGHVNRVLAEDIGSERFITMLFLGLDPATRTLTYVNAGHPAGYILDAQGQIKMSMRRTGVPLGMRPDTTYPPMPAVTLESGDVVLLLTDGIDEAMAPDDSIFGVERALAAARAQGQRPASEWVEALFAAVKQFAQGAPQLDDATAVVIRVL